MDFQFENGLELDISKILLEISNEKKKKKKDAQQYEIAHGRVNNTKPEYKNMDDALVNFKCPDCNYHNIKEIEGYYTCLKCGLKIETIIDSGQEWRCYNNDDNKGNDPARCDMPTNELLPKTSMGSLVGYSRYETFTTKRMRNINNWYSIPYKESTLMETFNNITIMAMNSGLNQCIIEEAKYLYKKVSEVKSSRRTKKEGMKAGAIFLACKLKGVPRNTTEIAKICHMKNSKTLRKSIKCFEEIWNILTQKEKQQNIDSNQVGNQISNLDVVNHITKYKDHNDGSYEDSNTDNDSDSDETDSDEDNEINNELVRLETYIGKMHRFVSKLSLDDKVFETCKMILEYVESCNYLDKHNPLSKIASVIFYVTEKFNIKINKHQIILICNVSEITINKCFQKLMKYKSELNALQIK